MEPQESHTSHHISAASQKEKRNQSLDRVCFGLLLWKTVVGSFFFWVEPHSKRSSVSRVQPVVPPRPLSVFTSITHSISPQNCRLPLTTHTTLKSHLPLFFNTPSISVFLSFSVLFLLDFANLEPSSKRTHTKVAVFIL